MANLPHAPARRRKVPTWALAVATLPAALLLTIIELLVFVQRDRNDRFQRLADAEAEMAWAVVALCGRGSCDFSDPAVQAIGADLVTRLERSEWPESGRSYGAIGSYHLGPMRPETIARMRAAGWRRDADLRPVIQLDGQGRIGGLRWVAATE